MKQRHSSQVATSGLISIEPTLHGYSVSGNVSAKCQRLAHDVLFRDRFAGCIALLIFCLIGGITTYAQAPGPNVNMVSGTQWPTGDPFLQRQSEPSMAASTRNPMHILAGANDYRTVDLELALSGGAETGDAWLGLFKSFDGGLSWQSTLLPGCPEQSVPQCLDNGALGGRYQAGADPVVRAGTNGMFYYAGLAFDRAAGPVTASSVSSVFVARFDDLNNNENSDTITYLDTHVVASGNSSQFLDKPSLAVDIPRSGATTCSFTANEPGTGPNGGTLAVPQSFPAGNVYLAYTDFLAATKSNATPTHLMFTRSTDCGVTWSTPIQLNTGTTTSQGSAIAVNGLNGNVYVTWRQFASNGLPDAIMAAVSTNAGRTFSAPVRISTLQPFDQGTTGTSFRTNSYPSITTDLFGFVYVAFSARGLSSSGDARVVVAGSINGKTWTPPIMVDNPSQNPQSNPSGRGHQLMPAITFAQGRLTLLYYDLRLDHYVGFYNPSSSTPSGYAETLNPEGELGLTPPEPNLVFTEFVDDAGLTLRRHTLDLRVIEFGIFPTVTLGPSMLVSQYAYGCCVNPLLPDIEQYKFNVPNLPLFDQGQEPFIGDYIDIAPSPWFLPSGNTWKYNFTPSENPLFHATWTDNRDVVPPANGDWTHYTPAVPKGTPSIFQPGNTVPDCVSGNEGMRNQNIYTSQIAGGLVVGAPGNAKPLGTTTNPLNGQVVPFQRAFAVEAQNITGQVIYVQLSIANQPTGGAASFLQFSSETTLQATIPANSSISRTVFVTSTNPQASVTVNVTQITGIGGSAVTNGLSGSVVLNPDGTNPQITNPNINNPNINNPNINNLEVTNPNINNPNINNPNINNPNINNPNINNPNINNPNINNQTVANASAANPNINNTTIANPDTANPNINNPNINNQDLSDGGTVTDVTYGITDEGNTTSAYTVKLTSTSTPPGTIVFQLIVNRLYQTPAAQSCQLVVENHWNTVANIINPKVYSPTDPNINNPDINNTVPNEATVTLQPGETGYITIRVMNPTPAQTPFDPTTLIPATVPQAVNTAAALSGNHTSPVVYPQLTIATTSLPPTDPNDPGYSVQLMSIGGKPGTDTWSIASGALPPGINLSPSGLVSGQATTPGSYTVTIQVADTNSPTDVASQTYVLNVSLTPLTVQFTMGEADGVVGQSYSATPLTVTGGTTPYNWIATNLPSGLSINPSTGQITGIPTTANPAGSSVGVTATDSATPAESVSFTTTIRIGAVIQISPPTLPNGIIGVPYSEQLSATGGIGALVFGPPTLLNGTATLSSTGLFTLNNPQMSSVTFTVSVHDQALPTNQTQSATYTIQFATAGSQVSNLTFVTQPSNAVISHYIAPPVQVRAFNNTATPLPGVSITLTLNSGPGTLSGTLTQITDATGTATFGNLSINTIGTADTLLATAGSVTATSNAFNITSTTPHACAPIPGAPIAWWPFNGNALDIRGGKPGRILGDFGTQSVFVPAEVGQGFKSTGEGVLISYPATPYLTPVNFTAAAWVRVDAETNDATEQILWQGDSGNTDFTTTPYSLGVIGNTSTPWVTYGAHATLVGSAAQGKIVATFSDGTNELDMFSNTALTPGVFYYVAITWNGPAVGATIWINGVPDQTSGPTTLAGLLTPTNPFQIGGIQGSGIGTESFNGVIDELQIWGAGITQFQLSTIYNAGATGECQAIWFTEQATNKIGFITPDGATSQEYTTPTANSFPYNIVAGSDGNVWFTEYNPNKIGVFESLGGGAGIGENTVTVPSGYGSSSAYQPRGITSGPDGQLWFTESVCVEDPCFVGSITTGGTINLYLTPTDDNPPDSITAGPDGNLWFTEAGAGTHSQIAKMTTAGTITPYQTPTGGSYPVSITTGGDGNLWFTESVASQIGVITTGGSAHEYPIPAGVNAVGISAAGAGYQIGDIVTVVQAGASGGTFSVSAVDTNGGVIVSPPGLNLQSIGTGYSLSTAPTNTTGGHGTGLQVNVSSTSNSFGPAAITLGPDGNVWFVAASGVANNIIEVSPAGVFTAYPVPVGGSAEFITAGPDGNIWYTDNFNSAIAQLVPGTGVTTEFPTPTANSGPWGIGIGPAVLSVPAAPTGLMVQSFGPGSASVSWTASTGPNVIRYNVYRSTSANGPFTLIGNTTNTTFPDSPPANNCGTNTFYYFVTAVGTGNTESGDSNQMSVGVAGPC